MGTGTLNWSAPISVNAGVYACLFSVILALYSPLVYSDNNGRPMLHRLWVWRNLISHRKKRLAHVKWNLNKTLLSLLARNTTIFYFSFISCCATRSRLVLTGNSGRQLWAAPQCLCRTHGVKNIESFCLHWMFLISRGCCCPMIMWHIDTWCSSLLYVAHWGNYTVGVVFTQAVSASEFPHSTVPHSRR